MVHPPKSWISNGIMCQDALCVCVCVCVSQLQIMCPHELHLVLMHIVYCQWCGCTNMIARRPYMGRDWILDLSIRPFEITQLRASDPFKRCLRFTMRFNSSQFLLSSGANCQSDWNVKLIKSVCLCALVPKCQYWRSLVMQGPCSQFVGRISLVLSFTIKGGKTSFLPIPPKVRYYGLRNFVSGRSQKIGHFAVSTLPIFRWWVHYADKWGINMLVKPEPSMASRGWETLKASNPPKFSSMQSSSLKTPKLGHNIANGLVEHVMGA